MPGNAEPRERVWSHDNGIHIVRDDTYGPPAERQTRWDRDFSTPVLIKSLPLRSPPSW